MKYNISATIELEEKDRLSLQTKLLVLLSDFGDVTRVAIEKEN